LNKVLEQVEKKEAIMFRDNILTRVLQSGFSSNCMTAMIVTASKSGLSSKDIHSTLKYGEKAMRISH